MVHCVAIHRSFQLTTCSGGIDVLFYLNSLHKCENVSLRTSQAHTDRAALVRLRSPLLTAVSLAVFLRRRTHSTVLSTNRLSPAFRIMLFWLAGTVDHERRSDEVSLDFELVEEAQHPSPPRLSFLFFCYNGPDATPHSTRFNSTLELKHSAVLCVEPLVVPRYNR